MDEKAKLEDVTSKYKLSRLTDIKIEPSQVIFRLMLEVNHVAATSNLDNITSYNVFSSGIRALQSNVNSYLSQDDRIYLAYLSEEISKSSNLKEKIKLQFKKLDHLTLIRDDKITSINYATLEAANPGALTQYIAKRITQKDSNFILGVFGPTRSGKSMCAGRIGSNITTLTNSRISLEDVVYNHNSYLEVKERRRSEGTLKGSVQIADEGGNIADAQAWWDKDVKEIVEHLRTQGLDNTCTIIVSPLYHDVANRARGLFHAIMYPWKELGRRYMELTDTGNIDYDRNISSWKLDFLDVDPMSGKIYKDKLKAALGDIVKVDASIPNKEWIKKYVKKSTEYKLSLQKKQREKGRRQLMSEGDDEAIEEVVREVLKVIRDDPNHIYVSKRGERYVVDWNSINNDYHIGVNPARLVKRRVEAKLNARNKKPGV